MHIVEGNFKSFRVGASDIPAGTAVKLSSGKIVAAAAATDVIIGVVNGLSKAGTVAAVQLRSAAGTINILASATIAAGDAVTSTASGTGVTTVTAGNQIIGYALEAGAANGLVELLPSTAKV